MPLRVQLPRRFHEEMVRHAVAELPNECCGLLAGTLGGSGPDGVRVAQVERLYALVNELASPVEYLSSPRSMFAAVRDMNHLGLEILAVYHSHPTSDAIPSRKDRERSYSSDVINFIISLKGHPPSLRGWWLTDESYQEAEWDWVEE